MFDRRWRVSVFAAAAALLCATEVGAASSLIGELPAAFRVQEFHKVVAVAHRPSQDRRSVSRNRGNSRLELADDGTLAWKRLLRKGITSPGIWQETFPGVVAVTFSPTSDITDLADGLARRLRRKPGFHFARVTCDFNVTSLTFTADGRRFTCEADLVCQTTGGDFDIDVQDHVRYRGRRTKR